MTQDLVVGGNVLQKGAAQLLVDDVGGALLQLPMGGLQNVRRLVVADRCEHLVAGQVDAQGIYLAGQRALCVQVVEDLLGVAQCLLTEIAATVEGGFDARGLVDGSVNLRIQMLRVEMEVAGATVEEAGQLAEAFRARCPVYTTLSRSVPIEIQSVTK